MSAARRRALRRTIREVSATLRAAAVLTVALLAGAALLAACAGSSGGVASGAGSPGAASSPANSPGATTPVPSPQITAGEPPAAAVAAVKAFWTVVGDGRLAEAQRSLVAPRSPILQWDGADIAGARFVRLVPGSVVASPPRGATVEFAALVWIEPATTASPWGEPGEHQLFQHVVRMPDGSWRMWDSGTGP
jgi:hypothetical protein